MSQTIKARTVQGVMWQGFTQLSRSGMQFVVTIILARLLFPKDFGTLGMAVIFIDLISKMNSLGFSAALVQRKELTDDHLSTAFWSNLMVGALLYGMAASSSPFVAAFFNNPEVQPIMTVLSLTLVIGPIGTIHSILLTRDLDFRTNNLILIGGTLASGAVSIVLALKGFGVWSMVLGEVVSSVINAVAKWFVIDWRPSLRFQKSCFKDLFSFGIYNLGVSLVNSGASNVDYLFAGKFLGVVPLGIYTMAYNLSTFSLRKITGIVATVTFSVFSRIQNDDVMMRRMYLKSALYVSVVTFPLVAGLFAIAPDLIQVVYTPKWEGAVLPLQILCIAGLLKSAEASVFAVYQAKGRPDIDLKLQSIYLMVLALGVWVGLRQGIIGIASAVTIVEVLFFVIRQSVVNRLIGLGFTSFWSALAPALLGSAAMVTSLEVYTYLFHQAFPQHAAFRLFSSIPIGAAIYLLSLWIFGGSVLKELIDLVRSQSMFSRKASSERLDKRGDDASQHHHLYL